MFPGIFCVSPVPPLRGKGGKCFRCFPHHKQSIHRQVGSRTESNPVAAAHEFCKPNARQPFYTTRPMAHLSERPYTPGPFKPIERDGSERPGYHSSNITTIHDKSYQKTGVPMVSNAEQRAHRPIRTSRPFRGCVPCVERESPRGDPVS